MLFHFASIASYLALLWLPILSRAQGNSTSFNQNVTIRFFPDGQDETCSYHESKGSLTFTTSSIPLMSHCFNFADLFGGNATRGLVNQTHNLAYQYRHGGRQEGIAWQLENMDSFDPKANYSRILYRQHVESPSEDYKLGDYAYRRINVYGGLNCSDHDLERPFGDRLVDWYGFDCFSEGEGDCGTLPYGIKSFTVQPGRFRNEKAQDGKCLVFAKMGAAARLQLPKVVMSMIVCVVLAVWLTV